jgi:cell division septation protein DedD
MAARDRDTKSGTSRSAGRTRDYGDDIDDVFDNEAPWLAPAGGGPQRTRVSRRSLFWTALVLLSLAAVATVGLVLLLSKKDSGSTQGYMNAEQAPLISAEPGPYKILPVDPKGLAVEGQDQTIYQAGEGIDTGGIIDMSALPEQPIPRPGTLPAEAPGLPRNLVPDAITSAPPVAPGGLLPAPGGAIAVPRLAPVPPNPAAVTAPRPAAPAPLQLRAPAPLQLRPPLPAAPAKLPAAAPTKPVAVPATAPVAKRAGVAQIGAFSSEAKANAAWATLAARHSGFAGFAKRLVPVESNGQTLWRLRVSGGDAAALCASMKASGDACSLIE